MEHRCRRCIYEYLIPSANKPSPEIIPPTRPHRQSQFLDDSMSGRVRCYIRRCSGAFSDHSLPFVRLANTRLIGANSHGHTPITRRLFYWPVVRCGNHAGLCQRQYPPHLSRTEEDRWRSTAGNFTVSSDNR